MKKFFIFIALISLCLLGSAEAKDCSFNPQKSQTKHYPFGYFYFMNTQNEIWKDIPEYEGYYQVSNMGRIRSVDRFVNHSAKGTQSKLKGRILIGGHDANGYRIHIFCKENIRKTVRIHQIVAKAFIPNPDNKPVPHHKNYIKDDNRAENLSWLTYSENTQDSFDNGRIGVRGKKHSHSKKVYQYGKDGELIAQFESLGDVLRKLGYKQSVISDNCGGRWNSAYGFVWSFKEMSKGEIQSIKIGHCTKAKSVLQKDLDGNVLAEFPSAKEAARITGHQSSSISDCCNKKLRKHHGFIWEFKNKVA